MSNFNFNTAAVVGNSVSKKAFPACEIANVNLTAAEARDVTKKDGSISKALVFTFEGSEEDNKNCSFEYMIWGPTDKDFEAKVSEYGPQPKGIEQIVASIKHVLLAVSDAYAKLDASGKGIVASSWDAFRVEVVKYAKQGIGKKTQIKLYGRVYENRLLPCFPSFPLAMSKDGQMYMKTNFIGDKLFVSPTDMKEFSKLKEKLGSAAPATSRTAQDSIRQAAASSEVNSDLDNALSSDEDIV